MRENKYDDNVFFDKYAQMPRSREGLKGAGEWETLKNLFPSLEKKRVLDLGCGYGWHAMYAVENGAASVVGTDISEKMIQRAREINSHPKIQYKVEAFEDAVYAGEEFDVIICSLMIHYLESFDDFLDRTYTWLKRGGTLAFTVEHPVFTAYGTQEFYCNESGEKIHFPVDDYFMEGKRTANFLGEQVVKYHRTLTTYLDSMLQKGLRLNRVVEPVPTEQMISEAPQMRDELRRPMMLIVTAQKV